MEYVEGKIEEEKVFGGKVFPKTLNPNPINNTKDDCIWGADGLVEMVKREREWLSEILEGHSAILFRGFGLKSAEEFGRVVEAFGWEEQPYLAPAPRPKVRHAVGSRVYTANATPPHQLIDFHHEMALVRQFPSKIFFFCSQPASEGGETSIVPSHIVVEQMEERAPEFVLKLSASGLIHRVNLVKPNDHSDAAVINAPWEWILDTQDEAEVESRAKEKLVCSVAKFREDGSGEIVFGPMDPIRKLGTGKRVWFNSMLAYGPNDAEDAVTFADRSRFPESAVDAYKKIIEENSVKIKWEKGDLLLLDNLQAQHARLPGKPPRQVLVSICK